MAQLALCTDKGAYKPANEDACCAEVAETPFGEVVMAAVCDGVGGLARGELASATVVKRFVGWFEDELPVLVEGMVASGGFDFLAVRLAWGALLAGLNELLRAYGSARGFGLGTTFTGLLCCQGRFLAAHVGDCRLYQVGPKRMRQVTTDQTLLAKKLASGELLPRDAAGFAQKNIILQSVGTERALAPAYYEGSLAPDELLVILSDGAYGSLGPEGVRSAFLGVDVTSEQALDGACQRIVQESLALGERDNLTVVCVSGHMMQVAPSWDACREVAGTALSAGPGAPHLVGAFAQGGACGLPTESFSSVVPEADQPTQPLPATAAKDIATVAYGGGEK